MECKFKHIWERQKTYRKSVWVVGSAQFLRMICEDQRITLSNDSNRTLELPVHQFGRRNIGAGNAQRNQLSCEQGQGEATGPETPEAASGAAQESRDRGVLDRRTCCNRSIVVQQLGHLALRELSFGFMVVGVFHAWPDHL